MEFGGWNPSVDRYINGISIIQLQVELHIQVCKSDRLAYSSQSKGKTKTK